ncbi:MAG: Eco57I restriction-modification methylase domain-containing protein [Flavobacterium sp.]|nr:Eco57I restriction-modification methylase domain-containing protein [Flavobacterium sp.]
MKPRKALNKAFLKVKPIRTEIESFKTNLISLLDRTNDIESEEFHKNLVSDFLKKTYYDPNHYINTKGRNDLVIHNGNNTSSSVGVIIEAKKPTNKSEMIKSFAEGDSPKQMISKLNVKAFQELVLYYLRERITHKNLEVKHLVATNINEWFIFDAILFDRLFAQNKNLVKQFIDFEEGRLSDTKTDFFYKQIAEPFISELNAEIEIAYFNIQDFQKPLRNTDKADDNSLIALFKLLSPEHLLKLPFTNDSNSLDKRFYSELLHIIGLTETKEGSKKLIERNKIGSRNSGTILEDTIIQLDSLDKLNRLENAKQFGNTLEERQFNVALELCITWINRILFLKLLEGQLITYHKHDKNYAFLNTNFLKEYDDLNSLFFQVLAKKNEDRNDDLIQKFAKVPYLNSSLFEPTELEHNTLFISNLKDAKTIPLHSQTVLKDQNGKKLTGDIAALDYLFEFLNAYDFSSEGSEEIQEENKSIINASVLGLIFEKINGYKDGSFFTPGFITMYMCRETIRKAVVQKFKEHCLNNDLLDIEINSIGNIYDLIPQKITRKKANEIVNSLKICDPAVGSGHFLVSALNEIIAIKNDLKIIEDREGKSLHRYEIEVVNDDLTITDEEGALFEYNPSIKESQRIQETLFHEKQTIIENCLFGVDINTNSVKICRLRLWIELLKNAYYKNSTELETLPNIDINIKCGNSLVSRFAIDADLKQALKKSKWTIDAYRIAVDTYRNAKNKEQKREMERLILEIKQNFSSEIRMSDPLKKRLDKIASELYHRFTGTFLFEPEAPYGKDGKSIEKKRKAEQGKLEKEIEEINTKIEEIKNSKIFENAFEWRFEFPEVLNDEGDFVGFDVVIGNPPYGATLLENEKQWLLNKFSNQDYQLDTYLLFIEQVYGLMRDFGEFTFIIPNTWITNLKFKKIRRFIFENTFVHEIVHYNKAVFEEAVVDTEVLFFKKLKKPNQNISIKVVQNINQFVTNDVSQIDWIESQGEPVNINIRKEEIAIKSKLEKHLPLSNFVNVFSGMNPYEVGKGNPKQTREMVKTRIYDSNKEVDETYKRVLRGSDINKYILSWNSKVWIKYGDNLAAPRYSANFFDDEKIVVRQTSDKLIASIDKEKFVCLKNLHVITKLKEGKKISLKFLLGLINSKLLDFYYTLLNPEKGEALAEVKKENLSRLPINIENTKLQKDIIELVDKVLSIKQKDTIAETTDLEAQIDQLVYQLYNLTVEEIKIIENT